MKKTKISTEDMIKDVANSLKDILLLHDVPDTEWNQQLIEKQAEAIVDFITYQATDND